MNVSRVWIFFFLMVQILFGLDFGFTILITKKYRFIAKCFCFLFSCFIITIMLINAYRNSFPILNTAVTFEYGLYFLVLATADYTVCDFLIDFIKIDLDFNIDPKIRMLSALQTIIYMILVLWFKAFVSIMYCNLSLPPQWCEMPVSRMFLYGLAYLSLDVPLGAQSLIFHTAYYRLYILELDLMKNSCTTNEVLKKYKQIADVLDKIKPVFDRLFLIGLGINIPKFMYFVYKMLRYFLIHKDWLSFWLEYLYAARIIILLCIPSVVAEFVAAVPDRMKLEMNNRLLQMYDSIHRRDLKKFLRYMDARPLQYKVWRIIPIDLRLPICIFSVCTTYIVLIVQFTHLYD